MAPYVTALQRAEREMSKDEPKPPAESLPELKDAEVLSPAVRSARKPPAASQTPNPAPAPDQADEEPATRAARPTDPAKRYQEAFSRLKQTLGFILWDQKDFEELLVIDAAGRVMASTFEGHEGTSAEKLEYFQHARRGTYVQPVFLSPITNELTMVIATPIKNENLENVGVLAARLNLNRFYRLINDSTGLGETGETVVARKIDEALVLMAPTRHDAQAALKRKVALGSRHAEALQEAARGQSGSGRQTDYRGVVTLAAWEYVPSLEWGLLVKIDEQEAMQAINEARARTLVIVGVLIALVLASAIFAANALVRPLRELKEA